MRGIGGMTNSPLGDQPQERADQVIEWAVLDQRAELPRAALGFAGCSLPSYDRALWALRTWLDSWSAVGHVVVGMHRQGFDLQLTQYDDRGWRATFYTTGMEHSPTSATGSAGAGRRGARSGTRRAWVFKVDPTDRRERWAPADAELDLAVDNDRVWMACSCGAVINRCADED
jgi:hypothetical protein